MFIFKKNKDVVDLTELQRRGILKKTEPQTEDSDDYVNLSNTLENSTNPLGFLDNLASSNTTMQNPEKNAEQSLQTSSEELRHLNVKFEDLEYKLDRLMERLAAIETKLQQFENQS